MKYFIAIIFVFLSFNLTFAQAEAKKKREMKYKLEESRWKNIKKNLNLSDDKCAQLRNLESSFNRDIETAEGDKRKVIIATRDIELARMLSKEEAKKYESVTKRTNLVNNQF